MKKGIYADYSALTPIDPKVKKTLNYYYSYDFANPSSLHRLGVNARKEIALSRKKCAGILGAGVDEIYFVSGATEANNIAIQGVVENKINEGFAYSDLKIIVSLIEHSSVLKTVKHFEKKGVKIEYINVDQDGLVNLNDLKNKIDDKTILVSVMYVNNETGVIQPVTKVSRIIKKINEANNDKRKIIFHTDASQAVNYLDINVARIGAHIITFDGNKIYGPRNSGLMYIKRGMNLQPILFGGSQEKGIRAGTENLPNICGFTLALQQAQKNKEKENKRIEKLEQYFLSQIKKSISGASQNGASSERIPGIINLYLPKADAEYLVFQLDSLGIYTSTKSACISEEISGSYVLGAMGLSSDVIKGSIRISFGRYTKTNEVNAILKSIIKCYNSKQHGRN